MSSTLEREVETIDRIERGETYCGGYHKRKEKQES